MYASMLNFRFGKQSAHPTEQWRFSMHIAASVRREEERDAGRAYICITSVQTTNGIKYLAKICSVIMMPALFITTTLTALQPALALAESKTRTQKRGLHDGVACLILNSETQNRTWRSMQLDFKHYASRASR
ncbi:hypothetical protein M011DRAFT_67461 [Sporormia fimetaria CBS 119925]|uniref:Uncharacterized protein n=1 Tax=Sporormia fimetaria CBS 119925 TaxID=1340428 RepID=A0A6A6V839_9PLEO|nr:hypothetical protein M011DRAFT_67461 [Sporormia fimetaria CBS 119925]